MASNRRTAAAALAVVLASLSLYPVFTGMAWFWVGCGSVAVVALTGTATRLRRLPVAVVLMAGLVALLLYLNLAFSNARSLYHLLPTPASLAALWHIAGQGFSEASRYAPPVPGLRGMLLLAAAGIGITALLTDLIAVRLGSAALAGLPLLLLFTEPFTLSVSRGFLGTAVAFCAAVAGYLALLSSEAKDRIRDWEHPGPGKRDAPDTRPLAAAGRRVGFASVVLALAVPLVIPGLHSTRLFGAGQPGIGGTAQGGAGVGFPNPDTQLSQELHATKASPVLTYKSTSTAPDYLQLYTLDKLTDSGWQLFAQPESLTPVTPKLPPPPGLTSTSALTTQSTDVTFAAGLGAGVDPTGALPLPYPATSVKAAGNLRADRSTLMVFDSGVTLPSLKYSVTSLAEAPSPAELDAVPAPPAAVAAAYRPVPAAYQPLLSTAESVVRAAGAKTEFEEADALQDWLAGKTFSYTLNAPSVVNAAGLKNFLTVTKKGYCQQFSYAMAVLARLLGIPARVAIGFTSGTAVAAGSWLVTTHDAHSWPELYFQGYGWLRFEPTPTGEGGQGTAHAPDYSQTAANPSASGQAQASASAAPAATATGAGARSQLPPNLRQILGNDDLGVAQTATPPGVSPWAVFGLVVAGLAVLAAIAPWCTRRLVRRRRWHRGRPGRAQPRHDKQQAGQQRADQPRAGQPRADQVQASDVAWAHAAWQELRDDLLDYGAGYLPSESPRAAAARAGDQLSLAGPARAALGRIAMAEERARYAPAPADGSGLRADSAAARQAIAAAVPRGARWRARLAPSSVVGPALNGLAATADLLPGGAGPRKPGPRKPGPRKHRYGWRARPAK
jgi:transglutaminase-like putative cysteine protease